MEKKTNTNWKPTKKKSVAVILAVFFGIFSWTYTYKYDAWKFWLNLTLVLITLGFWGIVAFIWVIVDQAIKPQEAYSTYFAD